MNLINRIPALLVAVLMAATPFAAAIVSLQSNQALAQAPATDAAKPAAEPAAPAAEPAKPSAPVAAANGVAAMRTATSSAGIRLIKFMIPPQKD